MQTVKKNRKLRASNEPGRVQRHCPGGSKVQQQFRDECDINNIVARFNGGQMPTMAATEPFYGDISNVPDYQTALNTKIDVEKRFFNLSPELRAKFDNNPQKLLNFISDDKNLAEAIKLGLVKDPETIDMFEKQNKAPKQGSEGAKKDPDSAHGSKEKPPENG